MQALGLAEPTPIQRQAIPAMLDGRELLAVAPTGSGKTFAFLLPILASLRVHRKQKQADDSEEPAEASAGPRAVVLSPTRELAQQTHREMRLLTQGRRLRGRVLSKATAAAGGWGAVDVLFATPLRLAALAGRGALDLSGVRWLVLDEADKLFELGFLEQAGVLRFVCVCACVSARPRASMQARDNGNPP